MKILNLMERSNYQVKTNGGHKPKVATRWTDAECEHHEATMQTLRNRYTSMSITLIIRDQHPEKLPSKEPHYCFKEEHN